MSEDNRLEGKEEHRNDRNKFVALLAYVEEKSVRGKDQENDISDAREKEFPFVLPRPIEHAMELAAVITPWLEAHSGQHGQQSQDRSRGGGVDSLQLIAMKLIELHSGADVRRLIRSRGKRAARRCHAQHRDSDEQREDVRGPPERENHHQTIRCAVSHRRVNADTLRA